ncbi:4-O-beta-D-mannosyl-D-glucose phosphorylase [Eubacterium plexicaudatum ASF492]|uniref:Glycosidase n=1 Tax=Eubacterium plexicaudatum ASF492 TaxID=1235802 RepID=N2ABL0_9FIRM|nr:4-O-beta-D-mannosyl-D-glucose phosphorylase [Eubacterium plexicaudatum ASF492]
MKVKRCSQNPLIVPADVKPSRSGFKVDGVFNCGVTEYNGEVILLCRVAESVICDREDEVKIPVVVKKDDQDVLDIMMYRKKECPELDFSDSRSIKTKDSKKSRVVNLTSLSHLRVARSADGVHFKIEEFPSILPTAEEESWGMEDPRITKIEEVYYINYTSVTANGAATSLISTTDFRTYRRHGIIFAPENKDVTIFPEKIGGQYVAFNRPVPGGIGNPEMWIAKSPDLIHWGEQKHFCGLSDADEDRWDNGRIGGGAVPFRTEKGWVKIYHAADKNDRYCLGAFLLDADDPSKVLSKTAEPILQPETDYEMNGFFGNVVFTCGCLLKEDTVMIYYGAADDKICRVDIRLEDIFHAMK